MLCYIKTLEELKVEFEEKLYFYYNVMGRIDNISTLESFGELFDNDIDFLGKIIELEGIDNEGYYITKCGEYGYPEWSIKKLNEKPND